MTPRIQGERKALFLTDPSRTYDGNYTPSRQRALRVAPAEATAYIDACQASFAFHATRYFDDGATAGFSLSPADQLEFDRLAIAARTARDRLLAALRSRKGAG